MTTTSYDYDEAGRLTAKSFPASPAEDVAYTWDTGGGFGLGRLTRIDDGTGSIEIAYDARGNVVAETRTVAGHAHTVGYHYDAADRLAAIVYPSGRIVDYARDGEGRITAVTTRRDAAAPPVAIASAITWQPFGPLASFTAGNGLSVSFTHDQDYRLTGLKVEDPGSAVLLHRLHGYQDQVNLTDIQDQLLTRPAPRATGAASATA